MQVTFYWITILLAVIVSQSIFAAGLLLFSRDNRTSNRFLAVLILTIALWLSDDFMRMSGIYRQKPGWYFLPLFYSFGFGPLIWFYVRSLVNHQFRFSGRSLLHFIPLLIQVSLYLVLTFSSYSTKYWYWVHVHRPYTYRLEFDGTWLSLVIYLSLSFRLVRSYQGWLVNNFSEVSRIRLNWLKLLLGALIVLCIQWLVEIILRDGFNIYFNYDYTVELLGLLVLILGIAGLQQASLAAVSYSDEPADKAVPDFQPDPDILDKISTAMEKKKLYLNPTLSLAEFSAVLQLNSRAVSRHINAGFHHSFNDFVNQYRVEEVKRRLLSGELEKFTIMGIALDCGFNSKTNFNRIFKEFTGQSPSDFSKQVP